MGYPTRHLNFDEWRVLASADPEGFEVLRRKVLQAAIDRAPEKRRQRLQGLQWRIDQIRRRSTSPMAACISLSGMMWESFAGDKGLVKTLQGAPRQGQEHREPVSAKVIPLGRRDRRSS